MLKKKSEIMSCIFVRSETLQTTPIIRRLANVNSVVCLRLSWQRNKVSGRLADQFNNGDIQQTVHFQRIATLFFSKTIMTFTNVNNEHVIYQEDTTEEIKSVNGFLISFYVLLNAGNQ